MKVVSAENIEAVKENADGRSTRVGTYAGKRWFTQDEPDGLNFIFVRNTFHDDASEAFETPRHRHTFAQLKFVEKGSSNYIPGHDIPEGSMGYFPRMAYYGPQSKSRCTSIGMQFGFHGEHQKGPVWEGYRAGALARLKARGTIANGTYTDVDPETGESRVRDGVQAIYEEQYLMHTGKPLEFRPGRYEAPVLMHPKAFDWHNLEHGVDIKRLGAFFDHPGPNGDTRISMLRLDGGSFTMPTDRAQLAWTLSPGLVAGGGVYPELAAAFSPRGDAGTISADGGIEVYLVEFPRLDADV